MLPLLHTLQLISQYGQKMIDGTISDDEIKMLCDTTKTFASITIPDQETTEDNYSDTHYRSIDAIRDFIVAIGPYIPENKVHSLVERFIKTEIDTLNKNNTQIFKGTSMPRFLLAYAEVHYPAEYQKSFEKNSALDTHFNGNIPREQINKVVGSTGIMSGGKPIGNNQYYKQNQNTPTTDNPEVNLAIAISKFPIDKARSKEIEFRKLLDHRMADAHELALDKSNRKCVYDAVQALTDLLNSQDPNRLQIYKGKITALKLKDDTKNPKVTNFFDRLLAVVLFIIKFFKHTFWSKKEQNKLHPFFENMEKVEPEPDQEKPNPSR